MVAEGGPELGVLVDPSKRSRVSDSPGAARFRRLNPWTALTLKTFSTTLQASCCPWIGVGNQVIFQHQTSLGARATSAGRADAPRRMDKKLSVADLAAVFAVGPVG